MPLYHGITSTRKTTPTVTTRDRGRSSLLWWVLWGGEGVSAPHYKGSWEGFFTMVSIGGRAIVRPLLQGIVGGVLYYGEYCEGARESPPPTTRDRGRSSLLWWVLWGGEKLYAPYYKGSWEEFFTMVSAVRGRGIVRPLLQGIMGRVLYYGEYCEGARDSTPPTTRDHGKSSLLWWVLWGDEESPPPTTRDHGSSSSLWWVLRGRGIVRPLLQGIMGRVLYYGEYCEGARESPPPTTRDHGKSSLLWWVLWGGEGLYAPYYKGSWETDGFSVTFTRENGRSSSLWWVLWGGDGVSAPYCKGSWEKFFTMATIVIWISPFPRTETTLLSKNSVADPVVQRGEAKETRIRCGFGGMASLPHLDLLLELEYQWPPKNWFQADPKRLPRLSSQNIWFDHSFLRGLFCSTRMTTFVGESWWNMLLIGSASTRTEKAHWPSSTRSVHRHFYFFPSPLDWDRNNIWKRWLIQGDAGYTRPFLHFYAVFWKILAK